MIPQAFQPANPATGDQQQLNEDRICQKVVSELLRRQSVAEFAATLDCDRPQSPPRLVPIIGRNGLDAATASLDTATTISTLIKQLQAEEARVRSQSTSVSAVQSHNILSRSTSLPVSLPEDNMVKTMNMDRYKTELCRQFQETGFCKYGSKCQFAHGYHEIRNTSRHPKYKTDLCRTYHTSGICPYGTRCHYIHDEDDLKLSAISQQKQQQVIEQIRQYRAMHRAPLSPTASVASSRTGRRYSTTLGYADVAMSLGSAGDTPPSSISSSPAPSPTAFLYEDRYHSAPTPPTGFVAPPPGFTATLPSFTVPPPRTAPAAVSNVFTYPDLPTAYVPEPARTFRVPSPLNFQVPSDPMTSLVAGLQAAIPKQSEDLVKDCMSDFFMLPTASFAQDNNESDVVSPMDISRSLRLPIFSQLSKESE